VEQPARAAQLLIPSQVVSNPLKAPIRLALQGDTGCEDFEFKAGTLLSQVAATLNLFSDVTGIAAVLDKHSLETTAAEGSTFAESPLLMLESIAEGAEAFIEAEIQRTNSDGCSIEKAFSGKACGLDMQASVDGIPANSRGNRLHPPSASLDLYLDLEHARPGEQFCFGITGGGLQFQTPNLSARIGIECLLPSRFGGPSGRLYEIGSGQSHNVLADAEGALQILRESAAKVTRLYDGLLSCEYALEEEAASTISVDPEAVVRRPICIPTPQYPRRKRSLSQPIFVGAGDSLIHFDSQDIETFL
jgi:flagellin